MGKASVRRFTARIPAPKDRTAQAGPGLSRTAGSLRLGVRLSGGLEELKMSTPDATTEYPYHGILVMVFALSCRLAEGARLLCGSCSSMRGFAFRLPAHASSRQRGCFGLGASTNTSSRGL